ncbi:MAG: phosphotransferase family protein [Burkholderiales bacterium]
MPAPSPSYVADRLTTYLREQCGSDVSISDLRQFSVGFSWMTYGFTLHDGATPQPLILRLAPAAGILPTYRAAPEAALLRSVEPLGLPTPRALWFSDDPQWLGTPFLVCSRCPGDAPLLTRKLLQSGGGDLPVLAREFVDHLARLHSLDWEHSEFAPFARRVTREEAALQEVAYWADVVAEFAPRPEPLMEWVRRWLVAHAPVAPRVGIVHGDYRLGNFLAQDGRITGLLDWELAHVGDPHDDLGWALMPDVNGSTDKLFGVMDRSEVFERYEAASGVRIDPAVIAYYDVLSRYKLVAICFSGIGVFASGRTNDLRTALMGSQRARAMAHLADVTEQL